MQPHTVLELFKNNVKQFPSHIAIHSPERQISYAELDRHSNKIANFLIHKGIGQGHLVPVVAHRSIELIVALLGVMKSTAAYVPIDAGQPDSRKNSIIAQCASDIVLVTDSRDTTDYPAQTLSIKALLDGPFADTPPLLMPAADDGVYVIFTSGTTGQPKGVVIEHHSLLNLVEWHNQRFAMNPDSHTTLMAGVGFDVSQWEIFSPLSAGASLHVLPEETRLCMPDLHAFFCTCAISHAFVPTALVPELLRQPGNPNLALLYLFTAGEKLPPVNTRSLSYILVDYYGPTETTVYATCRVFDNPAKDNQSSIGYPVADTQVYILDEHFEHVPQGEIGELFITGKCLARGYLASPDLTAQRFLVLPKTGQRVYRTGDLGRFLPDQSIQYLGRNDDQLKIRGNRVELGEVQAALLRQPQVKAAAVLADAVEDASGKRLIAFVVPAADVLSADLTGILKARMKREVPDYMLPARYVFLDSIPCNSNGKTDKQALLALAASDLGRAGRIAVSNNVEAAIAEIWQKYLGHADFTIDDGFLEIGGHSMMAAAVTREIAERLAAEVFVRDLYETMSIRALAAELTRRAGTEVANSESEPVRQLQDDIKLPERFAPSGYFDKEQLISPDNILLTGATGFVGAHLLQTLLSTTRATIHCPVRAASPALARQRLLATLQRYRISLDANALERVAIYPADLSEPALGMTLEVYETLCGIVEVIYHSASAVNFIQPYSYMKKDNVEGLKQIIAFAAQTTLKPLILLSTISVYSWGHRHTGKTTMYEHDDIDQNLPAVVTDLGYVRSKWVMEKIADLAAEKGLPLMTFRLGYATCHSRTGEFAAYQWWSGLIQTCLALNAIPALQNLREGLTTVDYISEAIAWISRNPRALGKKFNLIPSPEQNLTLEGFFQRLESYCDRTFVRLPFNDWVNLWKGDRRAPLYPLSSLFRDRIVDEQSTVELYQDTYLWDCSNVQCFLEGSGIREPEFDAQLLGPYLKKIGEVSWHP